MPTIKAKSEFDVKLDAELLHAILQQAKAKKAPDATVRSLIQILTTRSYDQRQSVVVTYREFYGRYIAQDIRACVSSGCLRDGLLTLVRPYPVRDATAIHKALTSVGKDQHTLLEILSSRNWEELQELCKAYKELFNVDLSKTIKSEVFGKLEGFLQMLLRERRSEAPVEDVRVREAVRDLHDVACGKWGKDKHHIATMFLRESYPQLRQVFREYKRKYGQSVHTLIDRHMNGQTARMIALMARYVESDIHYFAHILHRAVNGEIGDRSALHRAVMGNTGEKAALMRVLLRQCDVNLKSVITTYEDQYGTSLRDDLCMCTDGDFRDLLMAVCGWPWPVRGLVRSPSMIEAVLAAGEEDKDEEDDEEDETDADAVDEIDIGDSPPALREVQGARPPKLLHPRDVGVLPSSEGVGPWAITPAATPRDASTPSKGPAASPSGATPPGLSPSPRRQPFRPRRSPSPSPSPRRLTPRTVSPAPPVTARSNSPPLSPKLPASGLLVAQVPPKIAVNGDS
ncbi:hypothetical protein CBR_g34742 [Chara braunii]|uniref:Annexin n=1 Tax=Chara braunii TaxID=69332 RepID=A0A388JZB4_CHABU|nr:hypothetical protein CBR_g34742 [Chara braunii]|eukprot:GBG63043.1 hypothetical protein CBR_g34742 [Chara braunii]